MLLWGLQILTVLSCFSIVLLELLSACVENMGGTEEGEIVWSLHASKVGAAEENFRVFQLGKRALTNKVGLAEERYYAGNRWMDDLYIDAAGERVRLYLNVQREKLYLTVMEGEIRLGGYCCRADSTRRIEIPDMARMMIADVEVQFFKEGGTWYDAFV